MQLSEILLHDYWEKQLFIMQREKCIKHISPLLLQTGVNIAITSELRNFNARYRIHRIPNAIWRHKIRTFDECE